MKAIKNRIKWAFTGSFIAFLLEPNAGAFTFDELKTLISKNSIVSIEKLIPALPVEMRTNYTYLHKSQSIQGASPLAPRAILFGNDASLILTFNGDPSQRDSNNVEIMEFDSNKKEFNLYKILFNEAKTPPIYSDKNPKICLTCHQNEPRPIWEHYKTWPGAYGGIDDQIRTSYQNSPDRDSRFDQFKNFNEEKSYKKFGILAKKHPLYSALLKRTHSWASPYYADNANSRSHIFMPNLRLNDLVGRLQAQVVYSKIHSSPYYPQYKYILLLALLGCPIKNPTEIASRINDHLSSSLSLSLLKPSFSNFKDPSFGKALVQLFGIDPLPGSRAYWLGFNNYVKSKDEKSSVYNDGSGLTYMYVAQSIFKDVSEETKSLSKYFHPYRMVDVISKDFIWNEFAKELDQLGLLFYRKKALPGCSAIEKQAIVELQTPRNASIQIEQVSSRLADTFQKCIDCHSPKNGFGPEIPFSDYSRLAHAMKDDRGLFYRIIERIKTKETERRMPLGDTLKPVEIDQIEKELSALKSFSERLEK